MTMTSPPPTMPSTPAHATAGTSHDVPRAAKAAADAGDHSATALPAAEFAAALEDAGAAINATQGAEGEPALPAPPGPAPSAPGRPASPPDEPIDSPAAGAGKGHAKHAAGSLPASSRRHAPTLPASASPVAVAAVAAHRPQPGSAPEGTTDGATPPAPTVPTTAAPALGDASAAVASETAVVTADLVQPAVGAGVAADQQPVARPDGRAAEPTEDARPDAANPRAGSAAAGPADPSHARPVTPPMPGSHGDSPIYK